MTKNTTTIIVSHRVSSAKNADQIIVLDEGRVVENGNHDSLINNNGYYAELYTNQMMEDDS
ncbi:ABC transporter [Nonlabens ulvanivorans]|nr:ABC transporter [Nonlabens ulvanivorans]